MSHMEYEQTGLILFTENYEKCVFFYEKILQLEVSKKKDNLTVFNFSGAYLIIENGGNAKPSGKSRSENPTIIRLNVKDLNQCVEFLKENNISVLIESHDWGRVAKFYDPDGNMCELFGRQ